MPLYEYLCENGHAFEKIQKFSDPLVQVCPTCGAAVRKLMSSPAIQFKGSGWYITDYAKKDSAAAGRASESAETKSDSKSEAKTDSKTESKTESKSETKSESKSESKSETKTDSKS
jgi:putative FmdB family regulatory protein